MQAYIIFAVLFTLNFVDAKVKLEQLIPLCSKSSPNLNECVKESGNLLIKQLPNGIRDFGLVPADPLNLPFMDLSGAEKTLGLKLNITDSTHTGISRITVTDAKVDLAKRKAHFNIDVPQYVITGTCDTAGRILVLAIRGHGFCNLTAYEMVGEIDITLKPTTKKGKNYLEIDDFKFTIVSTKGTVKLEGLFGGNKQLEETMNRFINENSQIIINEMKPTLQVIWAGIFESVVHRIFTSVPAEELYKP